jgi:hypothetical protein
MTLKVLHAKKIFILSIAIILPFKNYTFIDQLLLPPGEELLEAHEWGVQPCYDLTIGKNQLSESFVPIISYSWSKHFGVQIVIPYFIRLESNNNKSSGLGDVGILPLCELYHKENFIILSQPGLLFPTGSTRKSPRTGTGSYGLFLSVNTYHLPKDWFTQTITSVLFRTKNREIQFGSEFLFNIATGPVFRTSSEKPSIFYCLAELVLKNIGRRDLQGIPDENYGGTALFLGGSCSWQREKALIEIIIQFPVSQMLNGIQNKYNLNTTMALSLDF